MSGFLDGIVAQYRRLAGVKAISHLPELAGRVHVYSNMAGAADTALDEFADYARVYGVYAWVHKAVKVIADNVSALPVLVVDGAGKGVGGHPVGELLAYGNDTQTGADVWALWCVHMLLGGEGPVEFVPDGRGRPVEMWNRRPDHLAVIPDMSRPDFPAALEYRYAELRPADGRTIPVDRLLFSRFANPLNVWRGLAPIAALREGIAIDLFAQNWSKSFLKNNARPDFALVAPQGITPTERERYLAEFLRKGQGNPHLPVVLEEGITDIKTFSFAPKDIEWLEQRRYSRDEVGAVFGVPDEIMGYGKDTYENFQTALAVLWTLTLVPLVQRRDAALQKFCQRAGLLRAGERVETDLSGVDALNEDLKPKVEIAGKLWTLGVPWNVIDERLGLGVGPVPGGEVGYLPTSVAAVGQAAAQAAAQAGAEEQARAVEVRRLRTWAGKRKNPDPAEFASALLSEAEKAAVVAEVSGGANFFLRGATTHKAPALDDPEGEQADRMAVENAAEENIGKALHKQGKAVVAAVQANGTVQAAEEAVGATRGTAADALRRALVEAVDLGVSVAVGQLEGIGYGFDWTLANTAARDWATRYSGELIRQIDEATLRQVRQAVGAWVENGEPLHRLVAELEPTFGRRRARLIASTEVTRAYAEANMEAYRQSGVVAGTQWRTSNDERVCPVCGPLGGVVFGAEGAEPQSIGTQRADGLVAALGNLFVHPGGGGAAGKFTGRSYAHPPAHPGCILPGNFVLAPGGIDAMTKSFYVGRCVEVTTLDGSSFSVTQNHPVLTPNGWIAAQFLNQGMYVLGTPNGKRIAAAIDPDNQDVPTAIEEIFRAFVESGEVSTGTVPTSPEALHGEGEFIQGNIEIVYSNRFLQGDSILQSGEKFAEDMLRNISIRQVFFSGDSLGNSFGHGRFTTGGGNVGIGEHGGFVFRGSQCPACGHSPRSAAGSNAVLDQTASKHFPGDAQFTAEGILGFPSQIATDVGVDIGNIKARAAQGDAVFLESAIDTLDADVVFPGEFIDRFASEITLNQIVDIRFFDYSGHVYDLQSDMYQLYICNGVFVHNCRCWIVPVV